MPPKVQVLVKTVLHVFINSCTNMYRPNGYTFLIAICLLLFDKPHGVTGLSGREVVLSEQIPGAESATRVTGYNSPHPGDRQTEDHNKHPGTKDNQSSFDMQCTLIKIKIGFFYLKKNDNSYS